MAAMVTVGLGGTARAATGNGSAPSSTTVPISTGLGPNPSGATLRLAAQTNWVSDTAPTNVFTLAVIPHVPASAGPVEVDVTVDDVLDNRSDFDRSLTTAYEPYIVAHPIREPLSSYQRDAGGAIHITFPIGEDVGELHLYTSGVYPVQVSLEPVGGGTALAGFTTHLLYEPGPVSGPKLDVVWVVPIHAPPADPVRGTLTPAQQTQLSTVINAIAAQPGVPVTLQPTPDSIAGLEATEPGEVTELGQALNGREILADTWVPTALPAMLADNLADQVSLSLTSGDDRLEADLGAGVTGESWVQQGPVDQNTLSFLRGSQFDRVVLPEADLGPNPFRTTFAQPFEVTAEDQTPVRAAVADSGLASHFTDQPDPVLAAHQLLADLTQIYGDAPADQRGVVVVTPPDWTPNAAFLTTLLSGLAGSPVLAPVDLDSFFDNVPPAVDRDGNPLIRPLVTDEDAIRTDATGLLPLEQTQARGDLDALASTLPAGDTTVYPRLERLLLQVPSSDFTPAQRQSRLGAFYAGLQAESTQVELPSSRTVTLTARRGQLPINIVSLSDEPLNVLLQVQSDKLQFPGLSGNGVATIPVHLVKGNNLEVLTVEARTSGAFPLHINLLSFDGNLLLDKTSFTVQSTVLSGVGVILSVGAALFLIVWWGRHAWRTRRSTAADRRRHARGRAPAPAQ